MKRQAVEIPDRVPSDLCKQGRVKSAIAWFKSTSPRNKVIAIVAPVTLLTIVSGLGGLMRTPPTAGTGVNPNSELSRMSQFADISAPMAFTGMEPAELAGLPVNEQVAVIYAGAAQFDRWLVGENDKAFSALISSESARMMRAAEKEVRDKTIDFNSATGTYMVAEAMQKMQPKYAVLFRYADEGIRDMAAASAERDVYAYTTGYIRLRAALGAVGQREIQMADTQPVVAGYLNYSHTLQRLVEMTPAAQLLPTDPVLAPAEPRSPVGSFIQKLPNDKEAR